MGAPTGHLFFKEAGPAYRASLLLLQRAVRMEDAGHRSRAFVPVLFVNLLQPLLVYQMGLATSGLGSAQASKAERAELGCPPSRRRALQVERWDIASPQCELRQRGFRVLYARGDLTNQYRGSGRGGAT